MVNSCVYTVMLCVPLSLLYYSIVYSCISPEFGPWIGAFPSLACQPHCPVLSILVGLVFAIFTDPALESSLVFHHWIVYGVSPPPWFEVSLSFGVRLKNAIPFWLLLADDFIICRILCVFFLTSAYLYMADTCSCLLLRQSELLVVTYFLW